MSGRVDADELAGLIRRSAEGDTDAFMDFYDATSSSVYSAVLRVLVTPAKAERATHAVYIRLWRTAATFDPARCSLKSWILLAELHGITGQQRQTG